MIYFKVSEKPATLEPTERADDPRTKELPVAIRMLAATFTIENMEFSSELADTSSEIFKALAKDLEMLLTDLFEQIPGFSYVEVDSFERGSIICNFLIYTKEQSSATAEDFEKVLIAAVNEGKTGNYQITNVEVRDNLNVESVKSDKPQDKQFQPLKVIGVAILAGGVLLVIVILLVRVRRGNKMIF